MKCLVTIYSENPDSYMFHTVNIRWTKLQAMAMEIPIIIQRTAGIKEEELEDLKKALIKAKNEFGIKGVISGAIASFYQKSRIERASSQVGLRSIAPFWGMNPADLIRKYLKIGMEIIFTGLFAAGFDESWLGRKLDRKAFNDLIRLNKKFKVDLCGEGGEFETFVTYAPNFTGRIKIVEADKIWKGYWGVYLIKKAILENKEKFKRI